MKGGANVYEKVVSIKEGKQGIYVFDLNENPRVIDLTSFNFDRSAPTPQTWDTDSIVAVRFVNWLYEDKTTPYAGKLQYQWMRHNEDMEWQNVGKPVAFGEATEFEMITVHKDTYNSSGSQRVDYRILDESGSVLQVFNGSRMVNYSDYWTGAIGRAYTHNFAGCRTTSPTSSVRVWYVR